MKLGQNGRTKVSTRTSLAQIEKLVQSQAFVQQIDVIFPDDSHLASALEKLEAAYGKGKVRLTDVLGSAESLVAASEAESQVLMLTPCPRHSEDLWAIDPRGVVTLSVCKETYETLGIVGKPLPFKGHSDAYVIAIPLQRNTTGTDSSAKKQTQCVNSWEQRRMSAGAADWDVVYCSSRAPDCVPKLSFVAAGDTRKIRCEKAEHTNVHIPVPSFESRPMKQRKGETDPQPENQEDWDREVMELFEWVGLAVLGSPRISVNDRPDSYVAVYEPPQPSAIANVTHLRWRGLLSPAFVQSVIHRVSSWFESSMEVDGQNGHPKFVFVTLHSIPTSPVVHISPESKEASTRIPRDENEDTMCLLVGKAPLGRASWTMVECLGPWDTRWG